MATTKGDIVINEQQRAMEEAFKIAKEHKGRYLRNNETKAVFLWTPQAHAKGGMELLPESYEPPGGKPVFQQVVKADVLTKDEVRAAIIQELKDNLTDEEKAEIIAQAQAEVIAEGVTSKTDTVPVTDNYDNMTVPQLHVAGENQDIKVSHMVDPEKIKAKLRAG